MTAYVNLEAMISVGVPTILFYAVAGAVLVMLVTATILGRDMWPFSHYPMFAGRTDANAVRFFRLSFRLPSGETVPLSGPTAFLADDVHREIERRWSTAITTPQAFDAVEPALRFWREACRFDGALTAATQIELRMHVAQILADGEIIVVEKTVQTVATSSAI